MSTNNIEPYLQEAERRAAVTILRAHPEWTLGHVLGELERNGRRAPLLRDLTLGELFTEPPRLSGHEPLIDLRRLEAAKRLHGERFDDVVRQVIAEAEAEGKAVGAACITARVGGPRWKVQASLRRLLDSGAIERTGATSGTRYRAVAE